MTNEEINTRRKKHGFRKIKNYGANVNTTSSLKKLIVSTGNSLLGSIKKNRKLIVKSASIGMRG